jgi:hypothetical protein
VILLSTWVYEHLEMSIICLGMLLGLSHLGMSGWGVFIAPNTKLAVGEKLLLSAAHRIVRWCTGQCTVHSLVRLAVGLTPQATVSVQAFYIVHSGLHTGQSSGLLSTVPPGTSRWATFPGCTGQSDVWHRTVRCSRPDSLHATLPLFLGLHLIFIMSSFEVLLSSISWFK